MKQESWVDNIIVKKHINAKGIWWSQSRFATINDTIVFEQYLIEIGALISEIF